MNANLVMVMFDIRFGKDTWSLDAKEKLNTMSEIAQSVELKKCKLNSLAKTTGRYGTHFLECMWSNPYVTSGPDCCICSSIKHLEYNFIRLLESIGSKECGEEVYNRVMESLRGNKEEEPAVSETGQKRKSTFDYINLHPSECGEDYYSRLMANLNISTSEGADKPNEKEPKEEEQSVRSRGATF